MDKYKCTASIDGVCRNVLGNGTKCSGYSEECLLRPKYESLSRLATSMENNIKRAFGIKGDM